jgi:ribosome-associated toxin RatA of RatAB toxin-antitoxin module
MTGPVSCRVEQPSSASPAAVYDALMDVERWPEWMPTVSAASWEKHGAPDTGLGGVRRVGKGLNAVHDTVVSGTRPHHHAYAASVPRFWPIKDYRGDIHIEERPNGSLIIWTVTCASRIPGLEKMFESRLSSVYTRLAAALAQEAERAESSKDR